MQGDHPAERFAIDAATAREHTHAHLSLLIEQGLLIEQDLLEDTR